MLDAWPPGVDEFDMVTMQTIEAVETIQATSWWYESKGCLARERHIHGKHGMSRLLKSKSTLLDIKTLE